MKTNIGNVDRVLRIVVGGGLVIATAMGIIPVWGWIGVIPLVTGIAGFCPLYSLLKISTSK